MILRKEPTNAHAHVQFGKALAALGRTKEALEHLQFAVQLDPNEEEGHYNIGAFTNDEDFLARFMAASRIAGEKTWQLPMDEEYKEYLKSAFADLPNIGGRYGGSITAAWFLREFADPTPWVHLDIASTAWLDEGKAWLAKGPTGVAVRSFVELALDWNQ